MTILASFAPQIADGKSEIIVVPGIGGSGDEHWQTRWQASDPHMQRFQPSNWDEPILSDWIFALERAVENTSHPPILVAHSLGCLLVAHWQNASSRRIAGAFLVAVPDPKSIAYPTEADGFVDFPREKLRFHTVVVASSNDPFAEIDYSRAIAAWWGSGIVEVGALGHIGSESGVQDWVQGQKIFNAFTTELRNT